MIKLFISTLKITIRDRQLLFWSFMFPLMFTFIFGFFFGKGNTSVGTIALVNKSDSQLSQSLDKAMSEASIFKVQKENSLVTAKDLMKKSKVSAVVEIPQDFGSTKPDTPTEITLIADPGSAQVSSAVYSFVNSYLTQANFQVNNIKPTFSIKEEKTSSNILNYFDFVLIGLIGMALMNSSIQGISISMSKYREDKILKRITTTPLASWKFIVSNVASRLIVNIAQIALILGIGKYFFDAHIYGNLLVIFLIAMLGAVLFQLIGFTIAGLTKTTQAAEGMATAVTIPMMFLAGVFFPIDSLPRWLYSIVQYLPLAPLLRILRSVGLESASPFDNPINIIIVVSWVILALIISSYKFRLNEE